jgi:hypothetical protein
MITEEDLLRGWPGIRSMPADLLRWSNFPDFGIDGDRQEVQHGRGASGSPGSQLSGRCYWFHSPAPHAAGDSGDASWPSLRSGTQPLVSLRAFPPSPFSQVPLAKFALLPGSVNRIFQQLCMLHVAECTQRLICVSLAQIRRLLGACRWSRAASGRVWGREPPENAVDRRGRAHTAD